MSADTDLFAGLKVLDVGSWIAGPVAATILADYGADVIKVEIPGAGDPYRRFAELPSSPRADTNYTWQMDARNKRSLSLNLKTEAGADILRTLIADADIYITNQPLSMRRNLGLTYEDIKRINGRVIYASLTAYGEDGPERDREGFDLVAYWARSSLMDLMRAPGAEPCISLPGMGDHPTAVTLYAAIVTALLKRERTGEGSHVHTSLIANGLWSASCIAQAKFAGADFSSWRRPDRLSLGRALYETADGRWLQLTMVRAQAEVAAFLEVLGLGELIDDTRFNSPEARLANGTELVARVKPAVRARDSRELMAAFTAAHVPVALINTLDDVLADAQLDINDIVTEPDDAEAGRHRLIRHPVNVDGAVRQPIRPAPDVGEHNHEILAALGYSREQIRALKEDGVI